MNLSCNEAKKTKKNREYHPVDKVKMWNTFDREYNNKEPIECIYRKNGEREMCDSCESSLSITEEGFLGCTNMKCGIVYTDMLDQSAEWRFYGADDNQGSDPTRCGMPINPLLPNSSLGTIINGHGYEVYRRLHKWNSITYKERSLIKPI